MKKEQQKNIEKLEKVVEEQKKIPETVTRRINSKVLINIGIVVAILVYLSALYFGMLNIPTNMYIGALKILSITLLVLTIAIFEYGYRKDNEEIWLHGVEIMIIAIYTLYLIYLYSIYYSKYWILILSAGIIYLVYFAIKIILIQRKLEMEYKKSLTDISEIVKK